MATDFPTSIDTYTLKDENMWVDDSHVNNIQDAIEAIEAKIGIGTYSTNIHTLVYNFFTDNRKMWIYNSTAPTGWSTVAVGDRVIATSNTVDNGGDASGAYNVDGGNTASGDSFDNWEAHTHTNSHDHDIAAHNHWMIDHTSYQGAHDKSWNSSGTLVNMSGQSNKTSSTAYGFSGTTSGVIVLSQEIYTINGGNQTSSPASPSSLAASSITEARPQAAVGLVITKTVESSSSSESSSGSSSSSESSSESSSSSSSA